ncbi:tetratricopeptide repeat protein 19 homolog, mitochondrial [Melanaphis sacchari]|uniref:Tetratricopeptide repeat protein 19, mitochondrial n=1 Tax=Melanaphis sacchari TaxID=742174 RepID=A0A2H8TW30_9HEMI|nr:tetratricopeptide repeat protein 19 homolog, mitochondrial [Melanaphis sacchari]
MSLLFNVRLVKCIKRILPVVKHILINYNNRPIMFSNSKQSILNSVQNISLLKNPNATKSIIFGFSLLGLFGLDDKNESERKLIYTIKRGLLYLQDNNYNAFEHTLHDALKIATDLNHFNGITYVYDILANGALTNKDYDKAKVLFIKVVQRLYQQGGVDEDLNIVHVNLKIAKILEIQKDYNSSRLGFEFCLNILKKKYEIDPENEDVLGLYSLTLDAYARHLMNQGNNTHACTYFKKAFDISVKLNGELNEINVILLNDLGTMYYVRGMLEEALYFFGKAEKIGKHFPDMETFSTIYVNLGNIFLKQGLLKEAEKHCVEGMKNAKRHHYEIGKTEAANCLADIKKAME